MSATGGFSLPVNSLSQGAINDGSERLGDELGEQPTCRLEQQHGQQTPGQGMGEPYRYVRNGEVQHGEDQLANANGVDIRDQRQRVM